MTEMNTLEELSNCKGASVSSMITLSIPKSMLCL